MFYKGEIPFVRLLIPLILGIVSAMYWQNSFKIGIVFFLFISLALLFLNLRYKSWFIFKKRWIAGIVIHCFLLIAGFILTNNSSQLFDPNHFSKTQGNALIVKVISEPKVSGDILRFSVNAEQVVQFKKTIPVDGKLLIALKLDPGKPLQLNYGDVLLIDNKFNELDPPFNPSEFNFKGYLANQQIYHQTFINRNQLLLIERNAGNKIIAFALNLRKKLVQKYQDYLPDKEASSMASTLILGYRADLSKEVISAFSKTGTMHVLSVSGMHVGIVCLLLNFLLKPLNRNNKLKILRVIILIFSIWFYTMLTGFSPSACRAAMMLTFVIAGKAFNKNQNTYNLLAISAFLLLLTNPFYLVDVGFQLSYMAVFGLVYLHPKIYHSIHIQNRFVNSVWNYSALSIAAQLATFPISIYYFHQFPLYFLLSNLFIVIPVALIMYLGIAFLFIPFDVLLEPLGLLLNWMILMVNRILISIEHLPFSSLSGLWISQTQNILLYLILASLIAIISFKNKLAFKLIMPLIFLYSISISYKVYTDLNRHELLFYSLRKNSAIAYFHNGMSTLISDLPADDQTKLFSIKPSLDSKNANPVKWITFKDLVSLPGLICSPDFLQFGDYRVVRWTPDFNYLVFSQRLKVNAVMISQNPKTDLQNILKFIDFDVLLIDATNPDYRIKKWQNEASQLKIPVHVLKKNPAFNIKL